MTLSILGDKRTDIMGLSIIMIMIYHSWIYSSQSFAYPWSLFEIGVEVFLFLSGYGICHSLSNNGDIKRFYLRRLIKILPAYLIVATPYWAYYIYHFQITKPILHIIFFLSPLVILRGQINFWFVVAILCFYLIAPLYFRLMRKCRYHIIFPFVTLILVSLFLNLVSKQTEIVTARLPIFLFGMSLYPYRNYHVSNRLLALSIIFSIIMILVSKEIGYTLIMFFLITPTLTLLLALLAKSINSKILTFLGTITLELYLIHENIFLVPFLQICSWKSSVVLAVVCALPTAWLLHKACGFLEYKINFKQ